jgi:hypothetical protein
VQKASIQAADDSGWIDTSGDGVTAGSSRQTCSRLRSIGRRRARQKIADGRRQRRQSPGWKLVALPVGRFQGIQRLAVGLSIRT